MIAMMGMTYSSWLQPFMTADKVNTPWTDEEKQAAVDAAVREIIGVSGMFEESVFQIAMRVQAAVWKEAVDCGKLYMLYEQGQVERGAGVQPDVLRKL